MKRKEGQRNKILSTTQPRKGERGDKEEGKGKGGGRRERMKKEKKYHEGLGSFISNNAAHGIQLATRTGVHHIPTTHTFTHSYTRSATYMFTNTLLPRTNKHATRTHTQRNTRSTFTYKEIQKKKPKTKENAGVIYLT